LAVLWDEYELAMPFREAFDGEFAIDHGNDDTAIVWREGTIYDQHIPRVNASFPHGLSSYPHKESCRRMLDEVLIEVEGAIEVIIRRGRIPS
jgi:hypothetical protein